MFNLFKICDPEGKAACGFSIRYSLQEERQGFLSSEACCNTFSRLVTKAAHLEQVEASNVSYESIEITDFFYTTAFEYKFNIAFFSLC